MTASVRTLVGAVILALVASSAWAADYLERFTAGKAAIQAGNYSEGRDLLLLAIGERSKEGRFKVGMKYYEYFPSHWLAEAYLGMGELAQAEKALLKAESVKKMPKGEKEALRDLRRRIERAGEAKPPPPPPPPPGGGGPSPTVIAAKSSLGSGDYATARTLAQQAIQADPTDAGAREVLAAVGSYVSAKVSEARGDQSAGSLGTAENKLEEALRIDPNNSSARSLLDSVKQARSEASSALRSAESSLSGKRFDEAERQARRARELDSSLAGSARDLESRIASARREASRPAPNTGSSSGSSNASNLIARAQSALESGKLGEARRLASDAASRDGSLRSLARDVEREAKDRNERGKRALDDARSALAAGDMDEARAKAREAARLDKSLDGDRRSVVGDVERAEPKLATLTQAVQDALDDGDESAARGAIENLAADFPRHPRLTAWRGQLGVSDPALAGVTAYFEGDLVRCITLLQTAAEGTDARPNVLAVLASAHASQSFLGEGTDARSQVDTARQLFARALEKDESLELDARFFSPRVLELFDAVRGN